MERNGGVIDGGDEQWRRERVVCLFLGFLFLCLVGCDGWFRFVVCCVFDFFAFLMCKIGDNGAVVRLLVVF